MTKNVYSVAQVNSYIKNMFAQDFMLHRISVSGEVSNCKYHSSGHIYFTIKDQGSALNAIMFAGSRRGLTFPMQDGDHVIVTGSVEVYERDGRYQIYAREITRAGIGELYERYEALKRELEEMGMFAPEYKKPIPRYAMRVGVVTARTGAAIQDIRNISARRNPYVQLILYPAQVQGDGAVPSIIQGIQALDAMHLDVLIVGRGGGSIEDLWAFNEEAVARAVFDCETPVISAVGHETDTTIIDYVADLRAPTPSAAAELAVFDLEGFYAEIAGRKQMLQKGMQKHFDRAVSRYEQYRMRLGYLSPANQLNQKKQYLVDLQDRLNHKMQELIQKNRTRLLVCAGKLDGLSPLKRLGQGYSVVTDASGHTVTSIGQVQVQDRLQIHVVDGTIETQVAQIRDQSEK
ncbi:MAG: exodeoxyribonuclease VII large subunit [Lachnospiraceae bacterium]|nr:exodeoxyribonuclease VII large subunit [Lachnospiraceae bacterium]